MNTRKFLSESMALLGMMIVLLPKVGVAGLPNLGPVSREGIVPPTPGRPVASIDSYTDKVRVSWRKVRAATGYKVYRCTKATDESSCSRGTSDRQSPFDDLGARAGQFYYYRVAACSPAGCSDKSPAARGRRAKEMLPAPSRPGATNNVPSAWIQVTWAPVAGATGYQVLRCSGTQLSSCARAFNASASPYRDGQAQVDMTYYYRVKACNNAGCGSASEYAVGKRLLPVPAVPRGLRTLPAADKIGVRWNPSTGAADYRLYRCTSTASSSCGEPFTVAGRVYQDTGAEAGVGYYYRVKACNPSGCSAMSSAVQGRRLALPPPPVSVQGSGKTYVDKIRVSWSHAPGANSYLLYLCGSTNESDCQVLQHNARSGYVHRPLPPGATRYYRVRSCAQACGSVNCNTSAVCGGFSEMAVGQTKQR